jgi:thiol:disulfide interchange protein
MKTARFALLFAFLSVLVALAAAQPKSDIVSWTGRIEPADVRAGESARLILTASTKSGWHIYSLNGPEGPTYTSFEVQPNPALAKIDKAIEPAPVVELDKGFNVEVGTHEGPTAFAIPVLLAADAKGDQQVIVTATSQACNSRSCDPPSSVDVTISWAVADGPTRADRLKGDAEPPAQPEGHVVPGTSAKPEPASTQGAIVDPVANQIADAVKKGPIAYLWLSFGFGLLALLTPCVWPMVPITVSFFSKRSDDGRRTNIKGALAYCLGIMGTFTAIGLIVTLLFGATGIQALAANPYVNIGLGLLFVVLALNLFGVFEIVVPQSILSKTQSGTTKGGLTGPILMGLTFSLTTFTCTVPFVGTLLVTAANGNWLYPIIGMLAFSAAFAIPFFFLALFPQFLARMPKSGSWLVAVKAYMGFLELAAALKFLSNTDLVWMLGWLTRPVFLAVWFAIFAVGGLYLLGWLLLPHGGPAKIGPTRKLFGVATLAVAFYCLAAVNGAPLGPVVAFLPPDPYYGQFGDDLDSALVVARKERKGIFINFTGATCTNCRQMESDMFPRPEIAKRINMFVPVELYTDRPTAENRTNKALLLSMANTAANPVYVILAPDKTVLKVFPGSTPSESEYAAFLDAGKAAVDAWYAKNGG